MASFFQDILLEIPRRSVFAVGIPIILGSLSGIPARKIVREERHKVRTGLVTPPGRPRRWIFRFVWTGLFASMGWASYLAVRTYDTSLVPSLRSAAYHGLKLYWGQLALNLAWAPLFYFHRQTGLAAIHSALLAVVSSYMTVVLDKATKHESTYFLAPYCAWLAFATYWHGRTWWLSRGFGKGSDRRTE